MSKYDSLLSTIELIGSTNPVMDENGALTIPPTHKTSFEIDPKMIQEAIARKGEYDTFFEAVDSIDGGSPAKGAVQASGASGKVKQALIDAASHMEDQSLEYWTNDANIVAACKKLRPILLKIIGKL